jgi:hypothetical protein
MLQAAALKARAPVGHKGAVALQGVGVEIVIGALAGLGVLQLDLAAQGGLQLGRVQQVQHQRLPRWRAKVVQHRAQIFHIGQVRNNHHEAPARVAAHVLGRHGWQVGLALQGQLAQVAQQVGDVGLAHFGAIGRGAAGRVGHRQPVAVVEGDKAQRRRQPAPGPQLGGPPPLHRGRAVQQQVQAGLLVLLAHLNEDVLGARRGGPVHVAQVVARLIDPVLAEVAGRQPPERRALADVVAAQPALGLQRQAVERAQKGGVGQAGGASLGLFRQGAAGRSAGLPPCAQRAEGGGRPGLKAAKSSAE